MRKIIMIRNTNSDATDYFIVDQSGFYELKAKFDFVVKEESAEQLPVLVARVVVGAPGSCRTIQTRNVDVDYSVDMISIKTSAGTATHVANVNLEKGDRVRVVFDQPPWELNAGGAYHPMINRQTELTVDFKWGDGYDDMERGFTTESLEQLPSVFEVFEANNDATIHADPDKACELYHNSEEYTLQTFFDADGYKVRFYDEGKEIICINCETGEINFDPALKEPYKMMWLKFQEAFPAAFKSVEPRDTTNDLTVERILEIRQELRNDDKYNRAMGVLK